MKTLVVGATGATGKELISQLLNKGQKVKVIIRPTGKIPDHWNNNENVTIIKGNLSEMQIDEIADYVKDCEAIASCLGHNLTLKGIYGKPGKLVADAVQLLCSAIKKELPEKPVRFVLMNTAGNKNRDLDEHISFAQKIIIGLVRVLVPPHSDNELAAEYLRKSIGKSDNAVEWAVVRPDTLINEDQVSEYEVLPSPSRSAIFNPGTTSRINVANFMAELITNNETWNQWKGQMPVIYNSTDSKNST